MAEEFETSFNHTYSHTHTCILMNGHSFLAREQQHQERGRGKALEVSEQGQQAPPLMTAKMEEEEEGGGQGGALPEQVEVKVCVPHVLVCAKRNAHRRTYIPIRTNIYHRTYLHIHVYTRTSTCMHTHIHIHMHIE